MIQETLKNIRDQRNESRNRVIGRLDELLKRIPEELRNTEVIKRKIDDLEIKINDYDNEIKSLNDKIGEVENKVGLKQRIVVQKRECKEAINELEKAEEKLTKDLKKYSLGDEELETLLAEKSQIAIKEKELNKYDSSIIEARGVIKSIKKSIKNIDQNSAIELQEKFDETKRLSDEAQEKLSSNNNEIKTLEKLKEKVDEIDQELRDLDQEHSSLINLSNAFNGKEGSQHIGLETFALRKMFELVLLAANKRLSVMTKRYKLEIKTETKGRGQQGLDISVHDIFTDESRPAKTLSGGEKFMASLSLALGLSDIIQNSAKRNIRLDTIFIDEGF